MDNKIQNRDDFTQIKGIGKVRQKWLNQKLNVFTYAELASLTIDQIADQIKRERKVLARKEIISWLEQARVFTPNPIKQNDPEVVKSTNALVQIEKKGKRREKASKRDVWKPVASFVVEFKTRVVDGAVLERQTAVHHMEADASQSWPEIEQEKLCQWMTEQANIPQVVEEPIVKLEERPLKVLSLKAKQIKLSTSDMTTQIDDLEEKRPFLGHVDHNNSINLEVVFEQNNGKLSKPQQIDAQCHLKNRMNRESAQTINMKAVAVFGEQISYNTMIHDLCLKPGVYDLGVLVRGQSTLGATYYELPKLNVI